MNEWLKERLVCPRDGESLHATTVGLSCSRGHDYPVVCGIPVLLIGEANSTHWTMPRALKLATAPDPKTAVDPDVWTRHLGLNAFVQKWLVKTCGNLYRALKGNAEEYPIPQLRLPGGEGKVLLEVGCNWGRWIVAAARLGYRCIGIDPSLEALLAAQMVCRDLGVTADFVVADARHLPFRPGSMDTVFSYSVLQHFSRTDALASLREAGRVLRSPGTCLIQMPNKFGLRCLYHQVRRGFTEGVNFEVRYWTLPELRRTFAREIGPPVVSVDGFFGLGVQFSDMHLLPPFERSVVRLSECLRRGSLRCHALAWLADSVFLKINRPPISSKLPQPP